MSNTTGKRIRQSIPWTVTAAAGIAVWLGAMAAMAMAPDERSSAPRMEQPTGLTSVYQDRKSLQTVVVRQTRPLQ